MSARDTQLQLRTARWAWALGGAPLLGVRLTAFAGGDGSAKSKPSKAGDLRSVDVLAIHVDLDFATRRRAAICKASNAGAPELFWLRGVLDYLGGGDGYLVVQRADNRTAALREFASRLDVGILVHNDFAAFEAAYPCDPAVSGLFSSEALSESEALLAGVGQGAERLSDYTQRFYWHLPPHRNLQQAIAYLRGAQETLDGRRQEHVLLFGHVVFRYLLALYALCHHIVRQGYPDPPRIALAYLHGGELGLHEVQQRVRVAQGLLRRVEGEQAVAPEGFSEAPPYFDALLDLIERLLRRPALATSSLRQLVACLQGSVIGHRPMGDVMPASDAVATKLVNDVASFLARAAGVDRSLRDQLSDALSGDREPATGGHEPLRRETDNAVGREQPGTGDSADVQATQLEIKQ